jgi:hypothetical protein
MCEMNSCIGFRCYCIHPRTPQKDSVDSKHFYIMTKSVNWNPWQTFWTVIRLISKYGSKCIWLILFYFSSAPWHCHSSAMVENITNITNVNFIYLKLPPKSYVVDQLWNMQYIRSEKLKVVVSVVCPSVGPCCNITILKFGPWLCLRTLQKSNLRCQQALSHSQGSVYPEWIT